MSQHYYSESDSDCDIDARIRAVKREQGPTSSRVPSPSRPRPHYYNRTPHLTPLETIVRARPRQRTPSPSPARPIIIITNKGSEPDSNSDQSPPIYPPASPRPPVSYREPTSAAVESQVVDPDKPLREASFSSTALPFPGEVDYRKDVQPPRSGFLEAERCRSSETASRTTSSQLAGQPGSGKTEPPEPPLAVSSSTFRPSPLPPVPSRVFGDKIYQYRELQSLEFRLLRILPAETQMIECEIVYASISAPPRYLAISYAWGDTSDIRIIRLDNTSVPVAVSLYGALEALRRQSEALLVWADAVCIDQQNRNERTQQIQLMTSIYTKAESVSIWLGPEGDDSPSAIDLIRCVAGQADHPEKIRDIISSRCQTHDFGAVVSLFERDYWRRLWVVQEVFHAKDITVYCGSTKLPWSVYKQASRTFRAHKTDLDNYLPQVSTDNNRLTISQNQYTYSQALVYQGPGSLPDLKRVMDLVEAPLLEVLRVCRRKLAADARDKVFGILGVLPEEVRKQFLADYRLSVKDVYTNVVDYLVRTTGRLDVICDAIHFPLHTNSSQLPSFVPDWSHIPQITALGQYGFSAASTTEASCGFLCERRNKLELSAIYLDTIHDYGVAVGTLCTLDDYLMAFLHWRALLLTGHGAVDKEQSSVRQEHFCRTLCLDQVPRTRDKPGEWLEICYFLFASLARDRLPLLPLDQELRDYADRKLDIGPASCLQFLQDNFGSRMMGRRLCLTKEGHIGMGSGFMMPGDIVIVPLGCCTPILIRPSGRKGEYQFVGDAYIHGYMHGKAVGEWMDGQREMKKYILH